MRSDRRSVRRRAVLKALGVGVAAPLVVGGVASTADAASESWTVVVLSDTQKYAENSSLVSYAHDQTRWVVDNHEAENVRFVTHCGDVVENPEERTEWERMDEVMARLDGVVPYSTVPGNHDWVGWFDPRSIEHYRSYFGPARYDGRSWYGGSGPDGLSHYQFFAAGGYEFLHLGLEWEVPGSADDPATPFGWARQLLRRYADRPTIVTTHSYLRDDGDRMERVQGDWGETTVDGNPDPNRATGNAGETTWRELVRTNSQIFAVFNGHFSRDGGESFRVSENDDGLPVYQIMADYQRRRRGGEGWLRLVSFLPGDGAGGDDRIQVRTYSPSLGVFETDADSEFGFDLRFAERFAPSGGDGEGEEDDPEDETLAGDVDGDGDIDADDVGLVQRRIARYDDDVDETAADVDGDGDVDIADAIAIRNRIGTER
ncbi:Calcineurin-like phosphoesterase [Halogranum amylolyticum]|uniref:Calcineurin-like phosphoesterase n=1 Tax=Halogranum amylolyticum TaxID=660520 RepID=A0A1H8N0R4_9EURY|nr:metallophosphoesterase [Halogranum amylolyticum]SEO23093.1 Calcineurin-like phosphoesterase [Halogranum amylolyticum]